MADELKEGLTKRKKIIWLIIILLLLFIIAAIIYLFLVYFQAPLPTTNLNVNLNQAPVTLLQPVSTPADFNNPNTGVLADLQAMDDDEPINEAEQVDVILIAKSFAERFGSYSNQSDYSNFNDLEIFMTANMNNWIKNTYIDDLRSQNPNIDIYYAIETKYISEQIISLDETAGRAEIMIKTQRQEFENDILNPSVFYQDILLQLNKIDNQWKVNGAFWQ